MNKEIKIERVGTCQSLSGRSTLTYNIGCNEEKRLMISLVGNSGKGLFNKDWIFLGEVETVLAEYREPVSSKALYPLYKGKSANSSGFLMAALLKEGLVVEATGAENRFAFGKSVTSKVDGTEAAATTPCSVPPDPGQVGEE
ncbi:hypothetical protein [Geomonas propionica]|uniref:Uncharacterized protein n=1 Tax=Geomonas propionica TaxID=2798582 RepID=A0ABS0YWE6_9BACT|nr:hypothetical protein [Geomonas propionica]MBJ6802067.1 hypothetical protein [Geomonas propionica]